MREIFLRQVCTPSSCFQKNWAEMASNSHGALASASKCVQEMCGGRSLKRRNCWEWREETGLRLEREHTQWKRPRRDGWRHFIGFLLPPFSVWSVSSMEPVPQTQRSARGALRLITAVWQNLLGYQYQTWGTVDDNNAWRNTVPDKWDNMHEIGLRHRWCVGVAVLSHARPPVSDVLRIQRNSGLGCFLASMALFCELWDKSREIKKSWSPASVLLWQDNYWSCCSRWHRGLASLLPCWEPVISAGRHKKKTTWP